MSYGSMVKSSNGGISRAGVLGQYQGSAPAGMSASAGPGPVYLRIMFHAVMAMPTLMAMMSSCSQRAAMCSGIAGSGGAVTMTTQLSIGAQGRAAFFSGVL